MELVDLTIGEKGIIVEIGGSVAQISTKGFNDERLLYVPPK
jgi:hypothetical protein